MNSELSATISLLASGVLHGLLFIGLLRSASGADRSWNERDPARFVGNTFEIDTVDAPGPSAGHASEPAAPNPEGASPPKPAPAPVEAPSAPPAEPPSALQAAPPEHAPELSAATEQVRAAPAPPVPRPAEPRPAAPSPAEAVPAPHPETATPAAGAPAATAGSQSAAASAGAPAASSGTATAYGQDALAATTASFAKAFTRAVPRIASADRVWHGLPLGSAGSAVFKIELDAQGKVIGQGTVLDEPPPAAHLARIIGRTILLLRNQTFALATEPAAPASQRFELSAEVRQVAALDDGIAEPEDLRQIGRLVEPTPVRPGKANFTYNSGRQVELSVRFLNP